MSREGMKSFSQSTELNGGTDSLESKKDFSTSISPIRERIEFLDGLRGLAILTVLLFHAFSRWSDIVPYGNRFADSVLFANGWLGVQLFFLISGFVIFMTLEKCSSLPDFLFRRWLRLFPGMLICSLLVFASAAFFYERPGGGVAFRDLLPGITFIEPAWWECILGSKQGVVEGAFWSLFVEVKFYVFSGLLYFLIGGRATIFALFSCFFALVLVHRVPDFAGRELITIFLDIIDAKFYGWFAAGALFFNSYRAGKKLTLLMALAVAILAALVQEGFAWQEKWIPMMVVIVFSSAMLSRHIRLILSARLLVFLGFVSYPLYLMHENMMVSLIVKTGILMPWMPALLLPVLPILFVVGLAWLVAVYGEPVLRSFLKNRLSRQRR